MIKTLLLFIVLLFTSGQMVCQTDKQIDSLATQLCKTLEKNVNLTDSIRIQSSYEAHLPQFIKKFPQDSDDAFDALMNKIFYRYQKNCKLVVELIKNNSKMHGDWKSLSSKPKNTVSKTKCRELDKLKKFYYIMPDGDRVNVSIDNGLWHEDFEDGTFSKLEFKWTSDCEFEIIFIESNNLSRKNFSSKGEVYHYGIYSETGKDYFIWVNDVNGKASTSFKLLSIK